MTTQPNLREMLDGIFMESWGPNDTPDLVHKAVKAWAFGQVKKCETCEGSGSVLGPCPDGKRGCLVAHWITCPTCHGTGEVRGPGLLERVYRAIGGEGDLASLSGGSQKVVLDALRAELGTP